MSDKKAVFTQVERAYNWVKQKRGLMPTVDEVALDVTSWGIREENHHASHGKYNLEYVYLLTVFMR